LTVLDDALELISRRQLTISEWFVIAR